MLRKAVEADPKHGERWVQVAKAPENVSVGGCRLSTEQLLRKVCGRTGGQSSDWGGGVEGGGGASKNVTSARESCLAFHFLPPHSIHTPPQVALLCEVK